MRYPVLPRHVFAAPPSFISQTLRRDPEKVTYCVTCKMCEVCGFEPPSIQIPLGVWIMWTSLHYLPRLSPALGAGDESGYIELVALG